MQKFSITGVFLFVLLGPTLLAAATVDWNPCKSDIEKFQCQKVQNDYDTYRCLTKHDAQLSKECYAVTTDYEREMGGE